MKKGFILAFIVVIISFLAAVTSCSGQSTATAPPILPTSCNHNYSNIPFEIRL